MLTVFQIGFWIYMKLFGFFVNAWTFCGDMIHHNNMLLGLIFIILMVKLTIVLIAGSITFFTALFTAMLAVGAVQYPFMSEGYKGTVSDQMWLTMSYDINQYCFPRKECVPSSILSDDLKSQARKGTEKHRYDEVDLEFEYDLMKDHLRQKAEEINAQAEQKVANRYANAK